MKLVVRLAVGLLALATTAAVAQQPGDGRPRGDGRRGEVRPDVRQLPSGARPVPPAVVQRPQPQPPVFRPQPPVVRPIERPRGPSIVFVPPPAYPVWSRSFGYEERYHDSCQRKAWRLRWFERRAAADGYFSWSEQNELRGLRRDVRRTCGDYRWRG